MILRAKKRKTPTCPPYPVGSHVVNTFYRTGGTVLYSDERITVFENQTEVCSSPTAHLAKSISQKPEEPVIAIDGGPPKHHYPVRDEAEAHGKLVACSVDRREGGDDTCRQALCDVCQPDASVKKRAAM